MKRRLLLGSMVAVFLMVMPFRSPAPLIYRPGEGWVYERVGGGKWMRDKAKDQFDVAQEAFDKKDFGISLKASRRTVAVWPLSDYAPKAQYLMGRSYESKDQLERAFKEYQKVFDKYPKMESYSEIIDRQKAIADKFLAGKWIKIFGVIPFFPSMDKTVGMYEQLIRNGPYSAAAPQAQMNIGSAREKQKDYAAAVKAYERAADRYHDKKDVAADAVFKAGMAYFKQAQTAEYDQSVAGNAITTFTDFISLFPNDPRVPQAEKTIAGLKAEQARGAFSIAQYYEKRKRWDGALIYYNEVLVRDPGSPLANDAKAHIETLKLRTQQAAGNK